MEIKTKFDIGNKVWTLDFSKKAMEFEISSIIITQPKILKMRTEISYIGKHKNGNSFSADEEACFASKEELMAYIAGDE